MAGAEFVETDAMSPVSRSLDRLPEQLTSLDYLEELIAQKKACSVFFFELQGRIFE